MELFVDGVLNKVTKDLLAKEKSKFDSQADLNIYFRYK
jgi:hypothetical protein